jgi:hypothetical protein
MKRILLAILLTPINALFGQTVTVDNLTPGEIATYTFTYTTANNLSGSSSSSDNLNLFSLSAQPAFSDIQPVANSIDSLAAHISVKINGIDEPFTANNFSDWLTGVSVYGVQISLHGTGNTVQAGSEIEVVVSGVFTNSATIATDTVVWSTAKGNGAVVESFESVATYSFASVNENNSTDVNLGVYPNPAQKHVSISGFKGVKDYVVYNNLGSIMMVGKVSENTAINIEQLTSGMYFFKLNGSNSIEFLIRE